MTINKRLLTVPALAIAVFAAPWSMTSASAAAPGSEEMLELTYGSPEISSDESSVTWKWKLTNNGDNDASDVAVIHTFKPAQKVSETSESCTSEDKAVKCEYGTVAAGKSISGWLKADLPEKMRNVQIDGNVTWNEGGTIEEEEATESPAEGEAGQEPAEGETGQPAEDATAPEAAEDQAAPDSEEPAEDAPAGDETTP